MQTVFSNNDIEERPALTRLFNRLAGHWKYYVPMSRKEAAEILKRDLPPGTKVRLDIGRDGCGTVSIQGKIIDESRTFDLKNHVINKGYIEIHGAAGKGKGLGRRIMRNEIEFFRACGVKKFNIFAALGNGGYTWARLGFLPDSVEAATPAAIFFREDIADRYKMLAPLLNEPERGHLEDAAKLKEPRDVWRLADARIDVAPRLNAVFSAAAAGDPAAIEQRAVLRAMDFSLEAAVKTAKELPAGRFLLAGTNWYGHLDFDNEEQMRRVEAYVGGIGLKGAAKR